MPGGRPRAGPIGPGGSTGSPAFTTAWKADGRDPAELDRLRSRRPVTPATSRRESCPEGNRNRDRRGEPALFQRRPWGRGDLVGAGWSGPWRSPHSSGTSSACRRALFYFDITEINYPYRDFFAEELQGRPVLAMVPGPLLRSAALQREPGGLSPSVQVPVLSLAGDLAGAQPRHGALGLADRRGHVSLAARGTWGPPGR